LKDRNENKYGKEGPLPQDKQLIITEYGLDHWLA
jgi:hypothetical protein